MQGYAKVQIDNEVIDLMRFDIEEAERIQSMGSEFLYKDEHHKVVMKGFLFKKGVKVFSRKLAEDSLPKTLGIYKFEGYYLTFSRRYFSICSILSLSIASSDGFMYLGEDLCFTYNLYKNRVKGVFT
jgi:hypothetical protein